MTRQPGDAPVARTVGRLRWGAISASAAVVVLCLVVQGALASEQTARNVLTMTAFYLPTAGACLFVAGVPVLGTVAWVAGLRVGRRSGGWLLWPAVAVGLLLVGDGAYEHRPATRFRELVADPVPASVAGLRLSKSSSFGEGHAWAFAFHVEAGDLATIVGQLGLTEATAPTTGPAGLDDPNPVDRLLLRDAADLYRRPAAGRFYVGRDRTVVVTDPATGSVWVYRNFWADPDER